MVIELEAKKRGGVRDGRLDGSEGVRHCYKWDGHEQGGEGERAGELATAVGVTSRRRCDGDEKCICMHVVEEERKTLWLRKKHYQWHERAQQCQSHSIQTRPSTGVDGASVRGGGDGEDALVWLAGACRCISRLAGERTSKPSSLDDDWYGLRSVSST